MSLPNVDISMNQEFELLSILVQKKISIYDLSKNIDIGTISRAQNLGFFTCSHDNRCILTDLGRARYLALSDDLSASAKQAHQNAQREIENSRQQQMENERYRKNARREWIQ